METPRALDIDALRALQAMPVASFGRVQRRLRHRLDLRLERFGVTGVQFGLLALVAQQDGIAQTSLQHQLAIEGATLTQLLQRLERDGWLRRSSDPVDRRRQHVWLTEKGRDLLPAIAAEVARHRAEVQRGLTDDDLTTLGRLLMRLEENALA